jgi:hypothetical protein
VTFAGNEATNVVVVSATQITAVTPPGVPGTAPVIVTDVGGSSASSGTPPTYTYVAPPVVGVSGLNPAFGPDGGGTTVTLTGSGLTGITSVNFGGTCTPAGPSGGKAGTSVTPISDSSATVVTPQDSDGPTIVCVTAAGGTTEAAEEYTFEPAPTINSNGVSPVQGPVAGGTTVTITGSGFGVGDPATTVKFGGASASNVVVVSPTEITAVTPHSPLPGDGTGAVNVTLSDSGGGPVTAAQQFTYLATPVVSGISPTSGPPQGGETITIKGTDLCNTTSVLFGGNSATIVSDSPDCTTLTVTEPPGTGTVPVTVTTPGGSTNSPENFTYIPPGYWMSASDGGVFSFGGAKFYGSVPGVLKPGQVLNQPIVAMADTADHGGYWLFAADGGVFAFGDAGYFGSVPGVLQPGQVLNGPIVAAEATPDGGGYRMFAADGGVFDFGDAVFEGSLPGEKITPSAAIAGAVTYPFGSGPNPNNAGYWLVGQDGGVYPFGNAPANLGTGRNAVSSQVVAMATTPDGNGYYMFQRGGGVNPFGDAMGGLGSATNTASPIVFGQATSTGKGYWEFGADGGVFTFGDAPFEGSLGGLHLNAPINAAIGFGYTG